MSRSTRHTQPGSLQFVVSRFLDRNGQMTCDLERAHYLTQFGHAMTFTDWKCLAYCLMGDQLQFAMIAGQQPLDSWTKRVHAPFAQWLNRRRMRIGPVFASRPATREIARADALQLFAFIHNSPVRAKLVSRASDVALSSHRAYVGSAR